MSRKKLMQRILWLGGLLVIMVLLYQMRAVVKDTQSETFETEADLAQDRMDFVQKVARQKIVEELRDVEDYEEVKAEGIVVVNPKPELYYQVIITYLTYEKSGQIKLLTRCFDFTEAGTLNKMYTCE